MWGVVVLAIVGGLALFGAIFAAVFRITRPLADAGRDFVTALSREPVETVWSGRTTARFRADVPWSEFAEVVARFALDRSSGAFWNKRALKPGRGRLRGSIATPQGRVRAEVDLVKVDGVWLVDRLNLTPPR
ncbi:hypothetical protein [Zavarzinia sp. CC-PAN008]|uniref:hypothetical protein n=1 Tax=Zavarzinia sp. CC-PAN008 TaxID=3243332 RepID=UPI003F749F5B